MFEQTKAYRIRFKLPADKIGKVRNIRSIEFDEEGIHTFEGTLEDFEGRARYLKAYGVIPLEMPDVSIPPNRPLPRGIGKTKVANVAGVRDDLDDLSEFKVKPDVAAENPTPSGDGQSPPAQDSGAGSTADLRHGSGSGDPKAPAKGSPAGGGNRVGSEDQVSDADFEF